MDGGRCFSGQTPHSLASHGHTAPATVSQREDIHGQLHPCEPAPYLDHRDLIAWQRAFDLATHIYMLTASFSKEELFGMVAQLRRASVSVVSNIAEGAGGRTTRDYLSFLHTARGSLAELETQLLLAGRVGLLSDCDTWIQRTSELGRLFECGNPRPQEKDPIGDSPSLNPQL